MTHFTNPTSIVRLLIASAVIASASACTVSTPRNRPDAGAPVDGSIDGSGDGPGCNANQPLRCGSDNLSLVRCNGDGTAELTEPCPLGCVEADLRCAELVPSNGLAKYLDIANAQPDLNLGDSAEINTDTGEVKVGGVKVDGLYADVLQQPGAPAIRVFAVRSLTTRNVDVVGSSALAIVSSGDIQIAGVFTASAKGTIRGPGAFIGGPGEGLPEVPSNNLGLAGGAGGGGFGGTGGYGGVAASSRGTVPGGRGGIVNGNESLVPLRGGCDGGGGESGGGGGALHLVSRSRIVVMDTVVASGGGAFRTYDGDGGGGGGSGGGILLEAPVVELSGKVAANGGGGSGCGPPSNGGPNATPAPGTAACKGSQFVTFYFGAGGRGGAGLFRADDGASVTMEAVVIAGSGGGGVGRIRINTATGDFTKNGGNVVVSPDASKGTVGRR